MSYNLDPVTAFLQGYVDYSDYPHMSSETRAQLREIASQIVAGGNDLDYLYDWLDSLIAAAQDYENQIAEYKSRAEMAEIRNGESAA